MSYYVQKQSSKVNATAEEDKETATVAYIQTECTEDVEKQKK